MRWWRVAKWVGLAGLAGVAATGVVVARSERRRASYTPDEIRARLHERLAAARDGRPPSASSEGPPEGPPAAGDHGDAV